MRNSNEQKHPYVRRVLIIALFMACIVLGNVILNYAFIPYSYVKVDYNTAYNESHDIVFIGTSHGKCGIQTDVIDEITGSKSVNMCLGGEYLSASYYMLKSIIEQHKPKKVVYELDYGYWVTDEYTGTDSTLIYRNMRFSPAKLECFMDKEVNKDFRAICFPWYVFRKEYKMIPKNIENKWNGIEKSCDISAFASEAQYYKDGGSIYRNPVADSAKNWTNFIVWNRDKVVKDTKKYFGKLVKLCKDNNVELSVVITPVPNDTIEKYSTEYKDCDEYFRELSESYNVDYINYNYEEVEGLDRSIKGYCDYEGHLTGENAMIFSKVLGEYLR